MENWACGKKKREERKKERRIAQSRAVRCLMRPIVPASSEALPQITLIIAHRCRSPTMRLDIDDAATRGASRDLYQPETRSHEMTKTMPHARFDVCRGMTPSRVGSNSAPTFRPSILLRSTDDALGRVASSRCNVGVDCSPRPKVPPRCCRQPRGAPGILLRLTLDRVGRWVEKCRSLVHPPPVVYLVRPFDAVYERASLSPTFNHVSHVINVKYLRGKSGRLRGQVPLRENERFTARECCRCTTRNRPPPSSSGARRPQASPLCTDCRARNRAWKRASRTFRQQRLFPPGAFVEAVGSAGGRSRDFVAYKIPGSGRRRWDRRTGHGGHAWTTMRCVGGHLGGRSPSDGIEERERE